MYDSFGKILYSLIFPRKPICILCEDPIKGSEELLCARCVDTLYTEKFQRDDSTLKLHGHLGVEEIYSVGRYSGALKKLIYEFKYNGCRELSEIFAEMLLEVIDRRNPPGFDFIIPVPLHPKRLKERGYNQALLLARPVSRGLKVPLCQDLVRVKDTQHQTLLNRGSRSENLREAFDIKGRVDMVGATTLLIDDVYTTGATARACAQALKASGIKRVYVLTLARG